MKLKIPFTFRTFVPDRSDLTRHPRRVWTLSLALFGVLSAIFVAHATFALFNVRATIQTAEVGPADERIPDLFDPEQLRETVRFYEERQAVFEGLAMPTPEAVDLGE
jgi:hypothetical protein